MSTSDPSQPDPQRPHDPIDSSIIERFGEREQTLLGKWLLGELTDDERRELQTARLQSVALDDAISLIEQTGADVSLLTTGDSAVQFADRLPDFYRPQRLAERLAEVIRFDQKIIVAAFVAATLGAAWITVMAPGVLGHPWFGMTGLDQILHLAGLVIAGLLLVAFLAIRQTRRLSELRAGGEEWQRTVALLRSIEPIATRRRIGWLGSLMFLWSIVGAPIVLVWYTRRGLDPALLAVLGFVLSILPATMGALLVGWARTFRVLQRESPSLADSIDTVVERTIKTR